MTLSARQLPKRSPPPVRRSISVPAPAGLTHRPSSRLTLAAMSATGIPAFWPMFEPRVPGFVHIDAPDPYRFPNDDANVTIGVAAGLWLLAAARAGEAPSEMAAQTEEHEFLGPGGPDDPRG